MPRVIYTYRYSAGRAPAGGGALPPQPPSLLGKIVGVAISIAILGVLTLVGLIVLPILLGAILIGGIYLGIKVWLVKRQFEQAFSQPPPNAPHPSESDYIDADYIDRD